jgi:hypothetical protein
LPLASDVPSPPPPGRSRSRLEPPDHGVRDLKSAGPQVRQTTSPPDHMATWQTRIRLVAWSRTGTAPDQIRVAWSQTSRPPAGRKHATRDARPPVHLRSRALRPRVPLRVPVRTTAGRALPRPAVIRGGRGGVAWVAWGLIVEPTGTANSRALCDWSLMTNRIADDWSRVACCGRFLVCGAEVPDLLTERASVTRSLSPSIHPAASSTCPTGPSNHRGTLRHSVRECMWIHRPCLCWPRRRRAVRRAPERFGASSSAGSSAARRRQRRGPWRIGRGPGRRARRARR